MDQNESVYGHEDKSEKKTKRDNMWVSNEHWEFLSTGKSGYADKENGQAQYHQEIEEIIPKVSTE